MGRIASRRLAPAFVVVVGVVAAASCGGSPERTPGQSPSPEPAAASGAPGLTAPREPDLSGIEVCAELPAETLAAALGLPVAEEAGAREEDPDPNCSYRFAGTGGTSRVDVYLRSGFDFDWALQTAKDFDREVIEVAGMGEKAYRKTTLDGWWEVWVRRPDGSVVQTTALEVELAEGAARAALRELF